MSGKELKLVYLSKPDYERIINREPLKGDGEVCELVCLVEFKSTGEKISLDNRKILSIILASGRGIEYDDQIVGLGYWVSKWMYNSKDTGVPEKAEVLAVRETDKNHVNGIWSRSYMGFYLSGIKDS